MTFEPSNGKYDRLSWIYDYIARRAEGVTIKELTQHLNVSSKTIQRDLHQVLSQSGIYQEGRRWKLDKTRESDTLIEEDRIVLGVLDSLAKQAGHTFYNKAHQLLEQISCQLDHPLFARLDTEQLQAEHLTNFARIEEAIKNCTAISVVYELAHNKRRNYTLKPIRLAFFNGFWYVLAFDANAKDRFKKFHLKSLKEITVLEQTYEIPQEVITRIEQANSVWFDLSKPFEVRLFVDSTIAYYFERKPLYNQYIAGKDKDGSIEIVASFTHEMEILPLILWYMPYIRILSPQWLNDALFKKIKAYGVAP